MNNYLFNKDQKAEYIKHLSEYGFCVIKNIIDEDTLLARINEIWEHPALLGNSNIDRNDPSTWTNENGWNTDDVGFLDMNGGYSETELEYYWKVRFNPDLVNVFKTVYSEDVFSYDRPCRNDETY